eukprot:m.147281 g.147281  ORF g.147281 m.147281 type:complete len:687 (-) comp11659_c2_seq1:78-2138(-)
MPPGEAFALASGGMNPDRSRLLDRLSEARAAVRHASVSPVNDVIRGHTHTYRAAADTTTTKGDGADVDSANHDGASSMAHAHNSHHMHDAHTTGAEPMERVDVGACHDSCSRRACARAEVPPEAPGTVGHQDDGGDEGADGCAGDAAVMGWESTVGRVESELRSAHVRMVLAKQRALRSQHARQALRSRRASDDAIHPTTQIDRHDDDGGNEAHGSGGDDGDGHGTMEHDEADPHDDTNYTNSGHNRLHHTPVAVPSEASLLGLPPELIDRVLAWLSIDEVQAVAATCKTVARHCRAAIGRCRTLDLVWIHHHQKRKLPSAHAMLRLVRHIGETLHTLRVHNEAWFDDELLTALMSHCPRLRALDMMYCAMSVETLAQAFNVWHLRELRIASNMDLEPDFFDEVDERGLAGLEVLALEHCEAISDDTIATVARVCDKLTHLELDGVRLLTNVGVNALLAHNRLHHLVSLSLDGEGLDDSAIVTVGTAARQLHSLRVSFCEELTDTALLSLASLTELRDLRLRKGTSFQDEAFVALFSSPEFGAKLRVIDLSECAGLGDAGLKCMATRCRALVSVTLAWCWELTDVGFSALIYGCEGLVKMDVTGVKRLEGGPVLRIPDLLPRLQILCVKEVNKMKDDELHAILDAMPDLTIIGFYGESLRAADSPDGDGWYVTGKVVLNDGLVLDY